MKKKSLIRNYRSSDIVIPAKAGIHFLVAVMAHAMADMSRAISPRKDV
jgi:hypothetical protein